MIYLEPNLYVRVVELNKGPTPKPLESGFRADVAYRVLEVSIPRASQRSASLCSATIVMRLGSCRIAIFGSSGCFHSFVARCGSHSRQPKLGFDSNAGWFAYVMPHGQAFV